MREKEYASCLKQGIRSAMAPAASARLPSKKRVTLGGKLHDCFIFETGLRRQYENLCALRQCTAFGPNAPIAHPGRPAGPAAGTVARPRPGPPDARKLAYREALKAAICTRWCAWCGISAPNKTLRRAKGKQLSAYEDSALRDAQNVLHSEFAYVMGIEPNEVPKFIAKNWGIKQPALRFEARAAFYGRVGRGIAPCVALRLPSPTNRKAEV